MGKQARRFRGPLQYIRQLKLTALFILVTGGLAAILLIYYSLPSRTPKPKSLQAKSSKGKKTPAQPITREFIQKQIPFRQAQVQNSKNGEMLKQEIIFLAEENPRRIAQGIRMWLREGKSGKKRKP